MLINNQSLSCPSIGMKAFKQVPAVLSEIGVHKALRIEQCCEEVILLSFKGCNRVQIDIITRRLALSSTDESSDVDHHQ